MTFIAALIDQAVFGDVSAKGLKAVLDEVAAPWSRG
jgi:hypothetical protein